MAAIQLPAPAPAGTIVKRPQYTVFTKTNWTDQWQAFNYLEALTAGDAAGPSLPRATFRWRAGEIKWEDQDDYETQQAVDLKMEFVKIQIEPPKEATSKEKFYPSPLWVGRLYEEELESFGPDHSDQVDQPMVAHGLAHELDRVQIDTSVISSPDGPGERIGSLLVFNDHYIKGYQEIGNRSHSKVVVTDRAGNAYAFANDADGNYVRYAWSVRDIIEYLLQFYAPSWAMWTISGVGDVLDTLDQIKPPQVKVEGKTIFAVLNELLDRKRGLGWRLKVIEPTVEDANIQRALSVEVFSVVDQDVTFGDATLAGNPTAQPIQVDSLGHMIASNRLAVDTLSTYDRIIINGAPLLACFTVSFKDGTLKIGWSTSLENDYRSGGSSTDPRKKDQERSTDKFDRVYARFLIPSSWNWMAGDGEGGDQTPVNIPCNVDGGISPLFPPASPPIRNWGSVLARSLPLVQLRQTNPDDLDLEYREPFVLVRPLTTKESNPGAPDDGKPDSPHQWIYAEATQDEIGGGAHVRMLDRDFGFHLKFHINHVLGLNHFQGTDITSPGNAPIYDYEKILATVAARTDERLGCIVDIASNRPDPDLDPQRILYIDVPDAESWFIVPGTVTDVTDGKLTKKTGAGNSDFILRDDSPRLRAIGALAKAWYGKPRATMTLTYNDITLGLPVGTYVQCVVDAWRAEPINSPVTAVVHDLQTMQTTITTNFCELDAQGAVPHVLSGGMSSATKRSIR